MFVFSEHSNLTKKTNKSDKKQKISLLFSFHFLYLRQYILKIKKKKIPYKIRIKYHNRKNIEIICLKNQARSLQYRYIGLIIFG
ncbi:hypothetical protein DRQ07_10155 [candidate division KSB1 bacterium]|nr:MAG: hypothetical protein DRQ07_10155 [candidate division KSB1 bacterium]